MITELLPTQFFYFLISRWGGCKHTSPGPAKQHHTALPRAGLRVGLRQDKRGGACIDSIGHLFVFSCLGRCGLTEMRVREIDKAKEGDDASRAKSRLNSLPLHWVIKCKAGTQLTCCTRLLLDLLREASLRLRVHAGRVCAFRPACAVECEELGTPRLQLVLRHESVLRCVNLWHCCTRVCCAPGVHASAC